jgi:hypothetical protein
MQARPRQKYEQRPATDQALAYLPTRPRAPRDRSPQLVKRSVSNQKKRGRLTERAYSPGRSAKGNPKLGLGSPDHTTVSARTTAIKRKIKRIWHSDGRRHAYTRASIRQIEDGAVEGRRPIIENYFSALEYASALNLPSILHGRPLYSVQITIAQLRFR